MTTHRPLREPVDFCHAVLHVANLGRLGIMAPPRDFAPFELEIPGNPQPWQRTASHAGRRLTPSKTKAAELQVALMVGARKPRDWDPSGNFALCAVFYRRNRHPCDADNLLKCLKDGITKSGLWNDDRQCTFTAAQVDVDADNARTVFVVDRHTSTAMQR